MQKSKWILIPLLFVLFTAQKCSNPGEKRQQVKISTPYGEMVAELFNETPQHRDNFVKLVQEGFYDSLLFHRVIEGFMIQGGDPNSKNAAPNTPLGSGGPGYTVPAEFNPEFYHTKGALSAARQGDQVNPLKASSGSQFYIVQGKPVKPDALQRMLEGKLNRAQFDAKRKFLSQPENKALLDSVIAMQNAGNGAAIDEFLSPYQATIDSIGSIEPRFYNTSDTAKVNAYATLGGTPHLDGDYTVFGQIISGLDIIDSIAQVRTLPGDRPEKDVPFTISLIK